MGTIIGNDGDLYDQDTGKWIGVLDRNGREQVVLTPAQAAALTSFVATDLASTELRPSAALILQRYRAAVVAAGGATVKTQLDAIEPLLADLISDASDPWSAIVEMHLPMGADGDLNAALVKLLPGLNNSNARTWSLTNTGPFVTGDYTAAGGIDPGLTNTTKYLDSDVRISNTNNSFTLTPSIGIGVMCVSFRPNTTGRVLGLANNNALYLLDSVVGNSQGLNGLPAGPGQIERGIYGIESYADGANNVAYSICNGVAARQVTSTTYTTTVGASGVRVFRADISTISNNTYGGYVLYKAPASRAQRTAIARFLRRASDALGRPIYGDGASANCFVVHGDSIDTSSNNFTANVTLGQDWGSLTGAGLGLSRHASQDTLVVGCSVGGRGVVASQTASGLWGVPSANVGGRHYQQIGLTRLGRVTAIKLGVNDHLQRADVIIYQNVLDTVVGDFLATGIDPAQLWLCTPPVRNGFVGTGALAGLTYATAAPYAAAVRVVAARYGCPVIPFYEHARVSGTPATDWDFDGIGIHPEAAVHGAMADIALTYGTMIPSRTW